MKQSGHLNPSEETETGCLVTSKYGGTPPNKHGGTHPNKYGGTHPNKHGGTHPNKYGGTPPNKHGGVGRQPQQWVTGLGVGFTNPGGTGGMWFSQYVDMLRGCLLKLYNYNIIMSIWLHIFYSYQFN